MSLLRTGAAAAFLLSMAVPSAGADLCSEHVREKAYEKAIVECGRYILEGGKGKGLAYNYYSRGYAYSEGRHDLDRAIEDYTQAIDLGLTVKSVYASRGNAYLRKGDSRKAIEDLTRAIEIDPKFVTAYNDRGTAHFAGRDYGKAIEDYGRAIALSPTYADSFANRGNAYRMIGQYDKAKADLDKALELAPAHAYAYNNRGLLFLLLGDLGRAEEDIRKSLDLDPSNSHAAANMGALCAARRAFPDACRWLEKAVQEGFTDWPYLDPDRTLKEMEEQPCYRALREKRGTAREKKD